MTQTRYIRHLRVRGGGVVPIKGVIVAAGYGTRFLPVTRVVPKELLPVVDRPAIDLVVQEFVDAGITDVLLISSRRKRAIEDWFDKDPELEAVFTAEGATAKLAKAQPPAVNVTVVRQTEMRGTGHALLLARDFAGDDPVVVAFPDDLFGAPNLSAQLIVRHEASGQSVLAAKDLSGQDVSRYGVLDVVEREGRLDLQGIVEKPAPGSEPSKLVSLGRYLYTPAFFEPLAASWDRFDGSQREFYPMEAIGDLAERGQVGVEVAQAPHYDTGAPLGYVKTVVEHALARADMGEELRQWLSEQLEGR